MISYPQTIRDEIYRQNIFSVDLLEIHFAGNPQYMCNGGFDIAVDTPTAPNSGVNTYYAQGEFLQFGGITEDFDVKVGKLSVTISGISDTLPIYTNVNMSASRVVLYRCFLDLTTGAVVESPILLFDGQIHNVSISESARSCVVSLDISSLFADFERTNGRKTNNDSNWRFQGYKFDTCFEKSGMLKNTDILWGRTS